MQNQFSRTQLLLGKPAIDTLNGSRVAVFGVGGVGGYVVEVLARSGVGAIDIIDNDLVNESNLNRQIIATYDTIGRRKTEAMAERIRRIAPDCQVNCRDLFYLPERRHDIPFEEYDYIVDAIDTVTAKIDLVLAARENGVPIISSMGTGNKLHPEKLEIADIYQTSVCPLAKVMRRELKARGVRRLKVVYSREEALKPRVERKGENGRTIPGSVSFVPSAAGLIIAGEVVRDLIRNG